MTPTLLNRTPSIPYRTIFRNYLLDAGEPLDRESRHIALQALAWGDDPLSRAYRLESIAAAVLTTWREQPEAQALPAFTRSALERAIILARPYDDGEAHLVIFTLYRQVLYQDTWPTTGSVRAWRLFVQSLWEALTDQVLPTASPAPS